MAKDRRTIVTARPEAAMLNALSVDVEDWFQVGAFETVIARDDWDSLPHRVERNSDAVLALFEKADVKATFFTLGWVAQRYPALIDRKSTRELQSLMRISYSVFCLKKKHISKFKLH